MTATSKNEGCEIHGLRFWLESVPAGHGACQECARNWCEQRGSTLGDDDGTGLTLPPWAAGGL